MANLYTPFTNGTFEGVYSSLIMKGTGPTQGNDGCTLQLFPRNNTVAFEGVYSAPLRCTTKDSEGDGVSFPKWGQTAPFRDAPGAGTPRVVALVSGKKYKLKARLRIPTAPIPGGGPFSVLGPDSIIGFGDVLGNIQSSPATPVDNWTDLGGGNYKLTSSAQSQTGIPGTINTMTCIKASLCYDAWVEVTYEFYETTDAQKALGQDPISAKPCLFILTKKGVTGPSQYIPIAAEQDYNSGAIIFIDKIELEEVIECDLSFGSPAYTKTNETAPGANNGTVTINANSSFTKEYSIDNINWQVSNVFAGLAPDDYTFYVRDSNPIGCAINVDVTINAYAAPACNLFFGGPAYSVFNASGPAVNDGSIIVRATSSYPIELRITSAIGPPAWSAWAPMNGINQHTFYNLVPGIYSIEIRDSNPNGCLLTLTNIVINDTGSGSPDPPPPEEIPLQIDQKPVNQNNFVSWFPGFGSIDFNVTSMSNCCWDIPAAYRIRTNNKNNMVHALIAVNGEEFTFYINFDTVINDPSFSDWKLALVNDTGVVVADVGTLQQDLFSDGVSYNIYASVTLNGVLVDKLYKLAIYNAETGNIIFVSGLIEVISLDDAKCLSSKLRYRATVNIKGFRYESLPDFYNIHRLRFYRVDEQTEATIQQYRSISSGRLRNIRYDLDRYIAFEAYYFDDLAHRAAEVWQAHDVNVINDKSFLVKTPYKRTFEKDKRLYKGVVEMYEQAFSQTDKFNRLGNINIIENSDLLLQETGRIKL